MPGCWISYHSLPRTWKYMDRYARKQWHRENELRALRGLPPRRKP